ncbi:cation transporter [Microbacterium sp. SCN 69-37]|uniref:cation transporter n=1 Tax=Microbacterium sp. SCN 69-37 TaxID=1660115 RepID=UPI0034308DBB
MRRRSRALSHPASALLARCSWTRACDGRGGAAAVSGPAVAKAFDPVPPPPGALTITAIGALLVNLTAAFLLVRHRHHRGSLTKAAWLSARNDALANLAIIAVGILTFWFATGWLDIIVGAGIGLLNADAARAVWMAARAETDPTL